MRQGNNLTCTSKPQKWHAPSKRQVKLHKPDELNSIRIKKPKTERILLRKHQDDDYSRADFDPRAIPDRNKLGLTSNDIDTLATATNGNCGIVLLMRTKYSDAPPPEPDELMLSHAVEVETEECVEMPSTIEEFVKEIKTDHDNLTAMFPKMKQKVKLSEKQIELVESKTRAQSNDAAWFDQQKDRVTASKFHMVASKITNEMQVRNPNKVKSVISNVCGYYNHQSSKAAKWGIDNEDAARKIYVDMQKKSHTLLKVRTCGFYISREFPFIGASPDGIVSCKCHNDRLLEIKCPWVCRGLSMMEFASRSDSCLEINNGEVRLKRHHPYFFQVQFQMGVTGKESCDFFVCIAKDSFVETIPFQKEFWERNVAKVMYFYDKVILPELFYRSVRDKRDLQGCFPARELVDEM